MKFINKTLMFAFLGAAVSMQADDLLENKLNKISVYFSELKNSSNQTLTLEDTASYEKIIILKPGQTIKNKQVRLFPVKIEASIPAVGKTRILLLKNSENEPIASLQLTADINSNQNAFISVRLHNLGKGYYNTIDEWSEKFNFTNTSRADFGIILDIKENLWDSTLDVIANVK